VEGAGVTEVVSAPPAFAIADASEDFQADETYDAPDTP